MTKLIQNYFKKKRLAKGLKLTELAKLIGYKNLSKGARRINDFEIAKNNFEEKYIVRMIKALDITEEEFEEIKKEHILVAKEEFAKWSSIDTPNKLYFHAAPCIYVRQKLTPELEYNDEKAIEYACNFAKERHLRITWLYLGRKEVLYIHEKGDICSRKIYDWSNFGTSDFMVSIGKNGITRF